MKILITGITGYIGQHLKKALESDGHEVFGFTSRKNRANEKLFYWNYNTQELDRSVLENLDVLIHLAGAGVADKPWTDARKKELIDSRVKTVSFLYSCFDEIGHWPKQIISASGINYYGEVATKNPANENTSTGNDFLAEVTVAWEKAVFAAKEKSTVSALRTSVVLGKNSKPLVKMSQPVNWFVGAPLGSGKQALPWVHIEDAVRAYQFLLDKKLEGTFNLVAPEVVSNAQFMKALGKHLHRPILPIGVPAFVLQALLGKMAEMVLEGTAAVPDRLLASGFEFKHDKLEEALEASV